MFKNKVGRPSFETIKKRRMFYIGIIVLITLIIGGVGFFTISYFTKNQIESIEKNVVSNAKYSTKKQIIITTKNKATVINSCLDEYVHYNDNQCINKMRPISQSVSFSKTITRSFFQKWKDLELDSNDIKKLAKKQCASYGFHNAKITSSKISEISSREKKYSITTLCSSVYSKYLRKATKTTVPYYRQGDYSSTYSACGGGNLGVKGCLPTSGSMIFSALTGKKITPVSINGYADNLLGNCSGNCSKTTKNGSTIKICDGGSYNIDFLYTYANNNQMVYRKGLRVSDSYLIEKKVKEGNCVGLAPLAAYGCVGTAKEQGICYNVGHFVIFTANQNDGYVTVKDPYNEKKANVKVGTKDLINSTQSKAVVLFCKKGTISNVGANVATK